MGLTRSSFALVTNSVGLHTYQTFELTETHLRHTELPMVFVPQAQKMILLHPKPSCFSPEFQ